MFQVSQSPAVEIQQTRLHKSYQTIMAVWQMFFGNDPWTHTTAALGPTEAVTVSATKRSYSNNIVGAVTAAGIGPQMDALHIRLIERNSSPAGGLPKMRKWSPSFTEVQQETAVAASKMSQPGVTPPMI